MNYKKAKSYNIFGLNSFVLSSIVIIFVISFESLSVLRVPMILTQFFFFYFFVLYKNKSFYKSKTLIPIVALIIFIIIQGIVLQSDELEVIQAIVMTMLLFVTTQIAMAQKSKIYTMSDYNRLSKVLLIILPLFLISFTDWNDLRNPGLFMNPNITSHLSLMLLPFIFIGNHKKRYYFFAISIVFLVGYITASRSAMLALLISVLVFYLVNKFPKINFLNLIFLLFSVTLLSIYIVPVAIWFINSFLSSLTNSSSRLLYTGYNGRDLIMQQAMDRFERQPMLGLGFDGTKFEIDGHTLGTHNGLIELLLKFGVIGSVIFCLFFVGLVWLTYKQDSAFKAASMMSMSAILSLSTNSSTFFVFNYLFIYTVVLVYSGCRNIVSSK